MIRARDVLKRLEDAAWRQSLSHFDPYANVSAWDLGRLSDAASVADDAILHVLSTARHNCHLKVTDAQLLTHRPAQAQAVRPSEEPTNTPQTPKVSPNGDNRTGGETPVVHPGEIEPTKGSRRHSP